MIHRNTFCVIFENNDSRKLKRKKRERKKRYFILFKKTIGTIQIDKLCLKSFMKVPKTYQNDTGTYFVQSD